MKQRIKQWWNGRTIVIDDGGYVPRVVEERPWLRKMYDRYPGSFVTVALLAVHDCFTGFTNAMWTELFSRLWRSILGD